MTENEARIRLRRAIGDWEPPPVLAAAARARLQSPPPVRDFSRAFVAGALAVAVLAVLLGWRLSPISRAQGAPAAPPRPPAPTWHTQTLSLPPAEVLQAVGLEGVPQMVTPLDVSATDSAVTLTAIGAYADPASTIVILSETPDVGMPLGGSIEDSRGLMNFSSSFGRAGRPGYYFIRVDGGAQADNGGLAHLTVTFGSLQPPVGPQATPGTLQMQRGTWRLQFNVPVQGSRSLLPPNPRVNLGSLPITLEVLEETPTVIHLQAVENGLALDQLHLNDFVAMVGADGKPVKQVVGGGAITVRKTQLTPESAKNVRLNCQWLRPLPGSYRLIFSYGGAIYTVPITVQ